MIEHRDNIFKVVSTRGAKSRYDRGYDNGEPKSALLHSSKAAINYNGGSRFTPPTVKDTPILCFDDAGEAFAFADKFPGRTVWAAEGYGEFIVPTQVLKIKYRGWDASLAKFWADVKAGNPLDGYTTISAQPHSIALFGVIRLTALASRPKAEAAAVPSDQASSPVAA